jgi:hypothetical protein
MEPEEKKILIIISAEGACSVTSQGIPSMYETIGILEMVKVMKINDALGIKPYVSPILLPVKPKIME